MMEVILRTGGETRRLSLHQTSSLATATTPSTDDLAVNEAVTNQTERGSSADDGCVFRYTNNDRDAEGDGDQVVAANSKMVISDTDGGHWLYIRSNFFPQGKQQHKLQVRP